MRYLSDVVTLQLDAEKCTGCGMCVQVCPHGVLEVENRHATIIDRDACMECGACAKNCTAEALSVRAGVGCAAAVLRTALGTGDGGGCSSEGPPCCG